MGLKRKILLVDDDVDIRRLLAADLQDIAETFESGFWPDAKRFIDEMHFDLIILDMLLSGATHPLEPLSYIHSLDLDYPVLLITGNKELANDSLDRLMRLGINKVLIKPFSRDEFRQAVIKRLPQK